jgi:teichuronic acid biosynthesis glycosyltransferase TuaC
LRALVVSNMRPDAAHPERGQFVRDQVDALRSLGAAEVELYEMPPGGRALAAGARELRARTGGAAARAAPDIVHAHFGLTAWPAFAVRAKVHALTLHGTDVRHPRTRVATLAAAPFIGLLAVASDELAAELPPRLRRRALALPCGVDTVRFRPMERAVARAELGRDPHAPCVLFPADPARAGKRHDRALALARSADVELLHLGGVQPRAVPLWVNAANAVLVPSEREGFGLAVLEALACDVPVLATPVGVHERVLAGVEGTLCAPFDIAVWGAALAAHALAADPRVEGRARAEELSATRMAQRVLAAWTDALQRSR